MRKLLNPLLRRFNYELNRVGADSSGQRDMASATRWAKEKLGVRPATVVDLGAAAGTWTQRTQRIWTDAHYVLFEPLEERRTTLAALAAKDSRLHPVFAAAGAREGTVKFTVADDLDGSGVYDAQSSGGREVPLTTVDAEIKRLGMKAPFVIKFDTHGFELPILEGAAETLTQTELVIMECYGFQVAPGSLLLPEMCAKMQSLGFRLADIVDLLHRPGDGLLWQCDVFFLKSSHAFFARDTYGEYHGK